LPYNWPGPGSLILEDHGIWCQEPGHCLDHGDLVFLRVFDFILQVMGEFLKDFSWKVM